MKLFYITLYREPGFSDKEKAELKVGLKEVKDHLEVKLNERLTENEKVMKANQEAIDLLLTRTKENNGILNIGKKSFGEAMATEIKSQYESKKDQIEAFQNSKNATLTFDLKTVGTMTTANLSGDGVATYNNRQGLVPSQKINFRDIIPVVQSETGIYVSYRETGGEGGIDVQTEGSAKSQIDYDLTEVKTVSGYIAGFSRFSKQLMRQLPFLQNTLPRLLLRDFYKKENSRFWGLVAAQATGTTASTETDDVKQLIDILAARADADFNNSVILCKNTEVARILKLLYDNQNYFGSGGVVGTQNGLVQVMGTPVIGVSFAQSADKVMILDTDFIERVETESLRVEFSYEDADNFTKNLVTARVECFEDLNLLRTDAHSYADMGNSASS
jgi:hypothetical protein